MTILKNKGGRPPVLKPDEMTLKRLRGCGAIQATEEEAAAVLGCAYSTLRVFLRKHPEAREAFDEGRAEGKASLRRAQFEAATVKKNPVMMIWLGKNWLGQTDRTAHEHTGKNGGPIIAANLADLTDEELDLYERIQLKLETAVSAGDVGGDQGGEGEEGEGEEPV